MNWPLPKPAAPAQPSEGPAHPQHSPAGCCSEPLPSSAPPAPRPQKGSEMLWLPGQIRGARSPKQQLCPAHHSCQSPRDGPCWVSKRCPKHLHALIPSCVGCVGTYWGFRSHLSGHHNVFLKLTLGHAAIHIPISEMGKQYIQENPRWLCTAPGQEVTPQHVPQRAGSPDLPSQQPALGNTWQRFLCGLQENIWDKNACNAFQSVFAASLLHLPCRMFNLFFAWAK